MKEYGMGRTCSTYSGLEVHTQFYWEILKSFTIRKISRKSQDNIKIIFKGEAGWEVEYKIRLAQDRIQVMGCNEPLCFIKGGEFVDWQLVVVY